MGEVQDDAITVPGPGRWAAILPRDLGGDAFSVCVVWCWVYEGERLLTLCGRRQSASPPTITQARP